MVLGKLSPEAMRGFLKEGLVAREQYFREFVEAAGLTVRGYYFVEGGEWDLVLLLEGQEEDGGGPQAVANGLMTQSTGAYASYRVLKLHSPSDVDAALADALRVRAPGA
jgi:hypothetical protein